MASSYDEAVTALYQTPHEGFVAERQRLAAELKASGDKPGAARFAKLARPSISAWAVNQLWWHARAQFDELFETASELRKGKLAARDAHRKALEQLTARARKILSEGGHAGSEGTIRRVTMTLSGLAAAGGFDPEPPGALTKDRDPPGFEAFGIASSGGERDEPDEPAPKKPAEPHAPPHAGKTEKDKAKHADEHSAAEAKRKAAAEAERARAAAEAEKKRIAEERARRKAERHALEARLREAKSELTAAEHERDRLTKELATAERAVVKAAAVAQQAETRLASARDEEDE